MASVSHRGRSQAQLRLNANDFGIVGNDLTDNRAALQRAIDIANRAWSGSANDYVEVYIPDGTYRVARNSTFGYCLLLRSGVRLVGESREGTILKQASSIASSVRLFYATDSVGAGLQTLTLDGNKANQTVNEHRHGVFIDGAQGMVIEDVLSQNFTGDGFYIYLDTHDLTFRNCYAIDNDRSGITFGRECTNVLVEGCTLTGNVAQEIDFEPATTDHIDGVRIIGNTIGSSSDTEYSLAIGGTDSDGLTNDVLVKGNTIRGAVFIVWATNVVFTGNTVTVNSGNEACVKVYRNCSGIEVSHNSLNLTRTFDSIDPHIGLVAEATGVDNQPDDIVFKHNEITISNPNTGGPTVGILVRGALAVTMEHNTINGPGGTEGNGYDGGILMRANVAGGPWIARYNTIRNIGVTGIKLYDTLAVEAADISYNDIDDTQSTATITRGIDFYDTAGPAIASITCIGNTIGEVITTPIDYPPSGYALTGYTSENYPIYTGEITPTSVVSAVYGSLFLKVNTSGVITATYERVTGYPGVTSTDWTLVA